MASPDGRTEVVVIEAVARARPSDERPARLSRERCGSCAMPVRRGQARCWSCGLDPTAGGAAESRPATGTEAARPRRRRTVVVGGGLVVILAVVLGSVLLLPPADSGQGVRGLAARMRGGAWPRAEVRGASAAFPAPPVHASMPSGPGLPTTGEDLVAKAAGLRIELLAADVGTALPGSSAADDLLSAYAAAAGGRVTERREVRVHGHVGVDALLDGVPRPIWVRSMVVGSGGYVLAVTGPQVAFQRFTSSFEPA
jgi:hypothetical protein